MPRDVTGLSSVDGLRWDRLMNSTSGEASAGMAESNSGVDMTDPLGAKRMLGVGAVARRAAQPGSAPTAIGLLGSDDHWDHEPGYSAASIPAAQSAAISCAAVTPEPQ